MFQNGQKKKKKGFENIFPNIFCIGFKCERKKKNWLENLSLLKFFSQSFSSMKKGKKKKNHNHHHQFKTSITTAKSTTSRNFICLFYLYIYIFLIQKEKLQQQTSKTPTISNQQTPNNCKKFPPLDVTAVNAASTKDQGGSGKKNCDWLGARQTESMTAIGYCTVAIKKMVARIAWRSMKMTKKKADDNIGGGSPAASSVRMLPLNPSLPSSINPNTLTSPSTLLISLTHPIVVTHPRWMT